VKKLKLLDAWIHMLLIISLLISCIVKPFIETLAMAYFIIGCWEVCSMVIHEWNSWFTFSGGVRRIYHRAAFIFIVTIPLGSFTILLYTAPAMFALYSYMCFYELFVKMRRPLALLK
jgi:hypothetical protein